MYYPRNHHQIRTPAPQQKIIKSCVLDSAPRKRRKIEKIQIQRIPVSQGKCTWTRLEFGKFQCVGGGSKSYLIAKAEGCDGNVVDSAVAPTVWGESPAGKGPARNGSASLVGLVCPGPVLSFPRFSLCLLKVLTLFLHGRSRKVPGHNQEFSRKRGNPSGIPSDTKLLVPKNHSERPIS